MYYLRLTDNNDFEFLINSIHTIKDSDIEISKDEYDLFIEKQSKGIYFRIKNKNAKRLFDILEEFIPEQIDPGITNKERLDILEQENADLLLDSALKDSKIEQLENDLSDLMLEIATMGGN
ncbi:hypothetical protein JGS6364_00691 [[Clostridium] sordellii]|uniref:hypothetical protein n=1 Tax=Paraclostridium sordellii TaxID=1505 RepID=UPI000543C0EF|nr:hypothetical protein [Paeniclostridium sordellii]CEK29423.1 hypothetical protein JGS6364_00691 [[Clostridium] sordellii] [Paeniclostridium sordellii]